LVADHLGLPDPFLPLVAAADAAPGLRVGTFVLNNDFHNPVLLARTVQTLVDLTGGRFELGLGSGHMKREYDDAGIAWRGARQRAADLAASIAVLKDRLGPSMPRLLVGGNAD